MKKPRSHCNSAAFALALLQTRRISNKENLPAPIFVSSGGCPP